MDEIEALQAELAAAQQVDSVHKLSEFNCVELVNKLREAGLLEVLYTTNGKEYLTPRQLQREIADEVMTNGGRINMVELPQILNVDMPHIEKAATEVVKSDPDVNLLDGEFIASYYLDDIGCEIEEILGDEGNVTLVALAKRFNFTTQYMTEVVQQRLGSIIHGHVSKGTLYTRAWVDRHNARARGLATAIMRPSGISEVANEHNLQPELVRDAFTKLVEDGEVDAVVKGQTFVPSAYSTAQRSALESFFRDNQCVEYKRLHALQIHSDPQSFLKGMFPSGHCLDTMFVDQALIDQVDANCEDGLLNAGWVDLESLAPSFLTPDDVSSLPPLLASLQPSSQLQSEILDNRFAVTSQFMQSAVNGYKPLAEVWAKKQSSKMANSTAENNKEDDEEEPNSKAASAPASTKGKGKKGKNKGGQGMGMVDVEDDDDDWSMGSKGKKGKGKGKNKGGGAQPAGGGESKGKRRNKTKGGGLPNKGDQGDPCKISVEELSADLAKWNDAIDPELVELMAAELVGKIRELRIKALAEVRNPSGMVSREDKQSRLNAITDLLIDIQVYSRGAATLEEADTEQLLLKHLFKGLVNDMIDRFVEYQAFVCSGDAVTITSRPERDKCVKELPKDIQESVGRIVASAKAREVAPFIECFEEASRDCQVIIKGADKKTVRNRSFAMRTQMYHALASDADPSPAAVMHTAATLLYAHVFNVIVTGPGRIIPLLLQALEQSVPKDTHKALTAYYELMVEQLNTETDTDTYLKLQQRLEEGREHIKKLGMEKPEVQT